MPLRPGLVSPARAGKPTAQALGPSTDTSTVARDAITIVNDGAAKCTVPVVAKDVDGATVAGATVVLTVADVTVTQPSVSDDYGNAVGSFVSSGAAGVRTIYADVAGRRIAQTVTCEVTAASVETTVTAVNPTTGALGGGTPVTITGTGFSGTPAVTFGGHAATSVVVVSATSITCLTPADDAGAVDVVVGAAAALVGAFTYTAYAAPDLVVNASFETGEGGDGWAGFQDNGGGTPDFVARVTDRAYAGTYSVYRQLPVPASANWHQFNAMGTAQNRWWLRFYYYLDAAYDGIHKLAIHRAGVGGALLGGWELSDVHLAWNFYLGTNPMTYLKDLSDVIGGWHCLEVDYWRHGDTANGGNDYPSAAFWFDGTPITTHQHTLGSPLSWIDGRLNAGEAAGSGVMSIVNLMEVQNAGNTNSANEWMDRIAISSLGRIGP